MTDDDTREMNDESIDDRPGAVWPMPWAEITRSDDTAEINTGGDVAVSGVDTIPPVVDFGHGLRAYDGTVYICDDVPDADPSLWEPLSVHVERLVADALEDRTIDPDELVERAIEREMVRRDRDAASWGRSQ